MPRVSRMIPAAEAIPRMTAGKTNWSTHAAGPAESSTNPVRGVHPHQIAGSSVTRMAVTNAGMDRPRIAMLRAKKSSTPSGRMAATTPTGMPIRIATPSAMPPSAAVTGRRRDSSASTGWRVHSDSPRWPRPTASSHSTYCTWMRPVQPELRAQILEILAVGLLLSMSWTTSPGIRRGSVKTMSEASSSDGIATSKRRRT